MVEATAVMRKVIESWNARDRDGLAALADEDIRFVDEPSGREFIGVEPFMRAHYDRWVEAYPDHELVAPLVFGDSEHVCFLGRFVGMHTGTYRFPGTPDLPPTGKRIDGPFVFVAQIRDGKVLGARLFFDRLRVLEEEGILTLDDLFAQLPVGG